MILRRGAVAQTIPAFGRRSPPTEAGTQLPDRTRRLDDLRLFALTFLAGFLFVSVYLA